MTPQVRVSRGLKISAFHGHFFIRGTDLLALPNIDEDKSFAVEIAHEENALTAPTCCMQAALLYTTSSGERRIRVHTVQLPVTSGLNALYEAADIDAWCAHCAAQTLGSPDALSLCSSHPRHARWSARAHASPVLDPSYGTAST